MPGLVRKRPGGFIATQALNDVLGRNQAHWHADARHGGGTGVIESIDLARHNAELNGLADRMDFTCAISSGKTTLSKQFLALSETFGYGLEEFFDLTVKAVENSFADQESRQHLLETVILPAYEELSDPELAGPDAEESLADTAEETTD